MELGIRRLRSFALLLVLVSAIDANVFKYWYHGPNEETVKTFIAREVLKEKVKQEWNAWKQQGVFSELPPSGNKEKEITFLKTSTEPLNKIFGYLTYFPLLENEEVIYNIPVDGNDIKIKLTPSGESFTAKYLYTDASGNPQETILSESKTIMKDLISTTKDHVALRKALEKAMPKILNQQVQTSGTFLKELGSAMIPNDVKQKAFRNAIEAMLSTSVLRRSPQTWIAKAYTEVEKQKSNLDISMKNAVKDQWKEWRNKNLFTETTDPATGVKKVKFSNSLSISPIEIFKTLQYFPDLETGIVRYSIPIDGHDMEIELAPSASNNDFTAQRVIKDQFNVEIKIDMSDYLTLRKAIDEKVFSSTARKLQSAMEKSFTQIFSSPDTANPRDVFKNAVQTETQKTGVAISQTVQDKVFQNAVDLIAASIMLKKPVPKIYWMNNIYKSIEAKLKIEESKIKTKATRDAVKENWMTLNTKYTITNTNPKEITFDKNSDLTVKDIFEHLRHFTALESQPVTYKFPIDGHDVKLELTPNSNGGFTAKYVYEDANGATLKTDLSDTEDIIHNLMGTTQNHEDLSNALESKIPEVFEQKLSDHGKLKGSIPSTINGVLEEKVLRQTLEAMASMSLLGRDGKTWIDRMDSSMETERSKVEKDLNKKIVNDGTAKLKLELAASIAKGTNEMKEKWEQLQELGYIEIKKDAKNLVREIKVHDDIPYTLKDTLRFFQHFTDFYPNQGQNRAEVKIPIGGKDRVFLLSLAKQGVNQLAIRGKDKYWPNTTPSATPPQPEKELLPSYKEMIVNRGLNSFDSKELAKTMLEALESKLNKQPDFNTKLEVRNQANNRMDTKTLDTIRGATEFLIIGTIAESAHPGQNVKDKFTSDLAAIIAKNSEFPAQKQMPNLESLKNQMGKNLKEGRSPPAHDIFAKLLKDIASSGKRFDSVFDIKSKQDHEFPFMNERGGTGKGRKYLYTHGDDEISSTVILEEAAADHDGETIAKRARMSCSGTNKRKKRQTCSSDEVNDQMMVDEKSIEVKDTKVVLEIVDRRDATKRKRLVIPITSDELATPQLIKQKIANSENAGGRRSTYAKINKGLAIHGLIFSTIGAIDYFQRGDNLHGGVAVSQSLHTLGGLTGFNEIASKATKQVLRHAAFKVARGLNMERGLEMFSQKVEKFMEKGVGRLMGAVPSVGLAFDIYFIEQDIEALANLDLNNPEDVKMLPLRVVDLVLDVDTTVLNLIGTFFPAEPLVIALSIVRMAIDDFYVDIMEEMDKVKWNSPWAGFEFIGALFKGFVEGAADFFTGGLRRQMKKYSKQEQDDKKLLTSLKHETSYFKIRGEGGDNIIDFTKGELSSFGGFITFRMCDDGTAHLEIGDVTGNHETINETFKINHDVKDIVLGIGESREFLYEKNTAKLWTVIPIKDYKVIKNGTLKSSSLFGTYYGNNKNNKFYAVQHKKQKKKQSDHRQCDYGKLDIGFVTGHYHYDLYGRGGDDSFYLGPQTSKVTGGKGSDLYIVQSYGGNTVIDNFAEDKKKDMIIINVTYGDITCSKRENDLDVLYGSTHHIRITNWFVPGNTEYYRHVSFKSKDGIIFVAKETKTGIQCKPIAIIKETEKKAINISTHAQQFSEVQQIVGSAFDDRIYGNDINNIIDGGKGSDYLEGGKSEDTYIIRAGEGCDAINNFADDYKKTTDVLIFNVPYDRILLRTSGMDLKLVDNLNERSCVTIQNWLQGDQYQHMIFTSLDHLVFKINDTNNGYTKLPMILDYSSEKAGVNVSLEYTNCPYFVHHQGYEHVATVSDSMFSDIIIGNNQSNFLSCSGGQDVLTGGAGSDTYIVKNTCDFATIINFDPNEKEDLLLLDYKFLHLSVRKKRNLSIIIYYKNQPKVEIFYWYHNSSIYRHLWIRTKDGVTLRINNTIKALEPVEITKDPKECLCKEDYCRPQKIKFNLQKHPWKTVTRFQLKSSLCSYNIKGNDLNNYIDPGSGNGFNYQHLRGGNGADTYVLQHGYGEFNVIDNKASDNKTDTLKLGMEVSDIAFSFYGKYDVVLSSKQRPQSLSVRIKNYFKSSVFQHLQVVTTDEITFEIQDKDPFMKVIAVDLSQYGSRQNFTTDEQLFISEAQSVKGAENYPNVFNGTSLTREIDGGSKNDLLIGGSGNNSIRGRQGDDQLFGKDGDDIIFGGDGDDLIEGGNGNDYIYGGNGKDQIDGGEGGDTICFKGDGFDKEGVYIDLSGGFGKGADAEGDTYKSIEHVYGTIHNDTLIGSDSDNHLYGLNGSDTIIAKGGDDHLSGGDGSDRYILDNAYGIKTIDNYATDQVHDTLSLANTNSDDVCVFLVSDDLHIQVKQISISLLLYQKRPLSVVVVNWNKAHKYRHMNILFKDAFWPSRALSKIKQHIIQKRAIVEHTKETLELAFNSEILSWNPYQQKSLDEGTQVNLLQYDLDSPKNTKQISLTNDVLTRGTYAIPNFTKRKHYIFALLMKYCSAIIAKSYSLTYLGAKRPCSAINVPYSLITYNSKGLYAHESQANLICRQGFTFDVGDTAIYTVTCIDGEWSPKYPTCIPKADCPELPKPNNGHVLYFITMEGLNATYVCNKGFQLIGSKRRRCGVDGQWTEEDPKCERISCFQLPNVQYGSLNACDGLNSTIYGTLESPKHGFCVNLTCDSEHLQHWKTNQSWRSVGQQVPVSLQSTWTCRIRNWYGLGRIGCLPKVRLTQTTSNWHEDSGVLQEWDDVLGRWNNSLSRNTTLHQRVCAHSVGMKDYDVKPRVVNPSSESIQIVCPKIRFVEMITNFEGKLETAIRGKWQRTCLTPPIYSKRLTPVYEQMCRELGVASNRPGVGAANIGPTTHILSCSAKSSYNINLCTLKKYPMKECNNVLQCKRRCNNDYPVANGRVEECTGKFEGDTCQVVCNMGYRRIGASKVYCKNGEWSAQNGKPAHSRCEI